MVSRLHLIQFLIYRSDYIRIDRDRANPTQIHKVKTVRALLSRRVVNPKGTVCHSV